MPYPDLQLELDGGAVLCSNLVTRLTAFCNHVDDIPRLSVVTLLLCGGRGETGHQPWPGAGIDVHLVNQWEQALRRLERLNAATIAAVSGVCNGVALEILLATDYRLAATQFRIILSGSRGEVWPGMAIYRLAHQVGVGRSRKLVLFGGELSATQAVEWGLVDEIMEQNVASSVSRCAETLRRRMDPDIAIRRRLLLDAPALSFENALGMHLAACDRVIRRAEAATESTDMDRC
jgi:isomerase DpgB